MRGKRDWLRIVSSAGREFLEDNCTHMAAAISYYVLLSLFPALIIILTLIGLFLRGWNLEQRVIETVIALIPGAGTAEENILVAAIRQLAQLTGGGAIGFVGLAGLAWTASNMIGAVRHAINVAFGLERRRSFIRQKGIDVAMVFALGVFFLLSIASTALVETVRRLATQLGFLNQFYLVNRLIGESGFVWRAVAIAVPVLLSFVAFLVLYWVVPARRLPVGSLWQGAAAAAALFELSKSGFVFYLEHIARYNVIFGSLGAVVAFLFWVYLGALILLFGAELASACSQRAAR